MKLPRELPKARLMSASGRAPVDAEDLVVVALGRRHQVFEGTGTRPALAAPTRPRRRPRRAGRARTRLRERPGSPCRSPSAAGRAARPSRASGSRSRRSPRRTRRRAAARRRPRADPDDGAAGVERVGEELEHRRPSFEHVEQVLAGFELGAARVAEQAGGTADVELRPVVGDRIDERRAEPAEKRPLARRAASGSSSRRRSVAEPRRRPIDLLLEVGAGPVDEPGVDRLLELEHPLRDASRRGDHDDDHGPRLQLQHVDMPHRGGPERRCGDEREQARRLRERLGRRPECRLELAPTAATSSVIGSGRPSIASTSCSA